MRGEKTVSESNNLDLPFLIGQFREYLNTEEGRYYSLHLRDKEPKEIREIVANLEHLSKNSDEFVKLVLYGLLPCRDSKYAKRSVLPVHQNISLYGRSKEESCAHNLQACCRC